MPKNVCTQFLFDVYAKAYAQSIADNGRVIEINHADGLLAVVSATQPGEIFPKADTGPKT